MQDELRQLIVDTQLYLKDPLHKKGSFLATEQECAELKVVRPIATPPPIMQTPPPPPPLPVASPKAPPATDALQIKQTLAKLIPGMKLIDQIPDDTQGKKIASSWKEKITDADVILLACQQDAETIDFLKVLAKAIDTHLAKSKIIPAARLEKEGVWDLFLQKNTFRLIIASEGLEQLPGLMRFYRGSPTQHCHFLDKTPLLPLLSAPLYKQLDKKAQVWKTLCQMLPK